MSTDKNKFICSTLLLTNNIFKFDSIFCESMKINKIFILVFIFILYLIFIFIFITRNF